jgi:hypothetical protein
LNTSRARRIAVGMKRRRRHHAPVSSEPPELPEARPLPNEANPGGTEGVDAGWPGGASNLGEVINQEPEGDTTYSTKDLPPDAPRVEFVDAFICDKCGQAFPTEEALNVHRRTTHRQRR